MAQKLFSVITSLAATCVLLSAAGAQTFTGVLTQHNDNSRTGQNLACVRIKQSVAHRDIDVARAIGNKTISSLPHAAQHGIRRRVENGGLLQRPRVVPHDPAVRGALAADQQLIRIGTFHPQ